LYNSWRLFYKTMASVEYNLHSISTRNAPLPGIGNGGCFLLKRD
jgi:hypothetical protein